MVAAFLIETNVAAIGTHPMDRWPPSWLGQSAGDMGSGRRPSGTCARRGATPRLALSPGSSLWCSARA